MRWIDSDEADHINPTMAPGVTRGGTFFDEDGYIHPPRNVTAYTVALATSGVEVFESVSFDGLVVTGDRVTGVETSAGPLSTGRVVLTGGPSWPRWDEQPAPGFRPVAFVIRWPCPSLTPLSTRPVSPWSSIWPPGSTGDPRKGDCSSE